MSNSAFAVIVGVSVLAAVYLAWSEDDKEPDPPAEPPYESSYPLDTGDLPETATNLEAKRVEDLTPNGRVVLRLREGLFEYWADKPVLYKYLEVVARKYVIVFDCRGEYVNMFRELLKASEAGEAEPKKPTVFATFRAMREKGVVNEKANRYHWMGRLAELEPPPPRPLPKEIRYADFKKKV
jgi:hypothetical protein